VDARHRLACFLTFGALALLYGYDLGHTPVYLGGDEAQFAVQGLSIARTGRTLGGHVLPMFVSLADPQGDPNPLPWGNLWYQPMLFYLVAAVLRVLPFTEATVRIPNAIVGGVLSPLLMYAVVRQLTNERSYGLLAATLLGLTPPHLILSRQAMDYVDPIPFVLGWLWCTQSYLRSGRTSRALIGGALLGVGCYSYIASWIMMPICLALTCLVFWREGRGWKASLAAAAGFSLAIAPVIPWLWQHPEMLRETFARYRLSEPQQFSVFADPARTPLATKVRTTLWSYASFFHPRFLFVRGGPSLLTATGRVGVFLLPMAAAMPVGMYELWRRRHENGLYSIVLAGLVLAPVPAALMGEAYMIQRELFVVVWAAIIAVFGFAALLQARHPAVRGAAIVLLATVPLQFAFFYRDFFTHYKFRSAFYYDSSAFADTSSAIIAFDRARHAPAIYLNSELSAASARWRFYTTKYHHEELLTRTRYFSGDGADLSATPPGTLAVMLDKRVDVARLVKTGRWLLAETIYDVDRRPAAVILRKIV
jgi:hypothetical protein